jgi:Zn-dependent protease
VHISQLTVVYFVALVIAIILHEISHGVVALWFGDDTARKAGRLTLNPVPHSTRSARSSCRRSGVSGVPVIG